jgi:hypothetical protein
MPYVPRQATTALCAHCQAPFEKKHASRKYCSNPCNVQASYARNGRPGGDRPTRAELELMYAKMMALMNITPELATTSPVAAKAQPRKPAAKAVVKQASKPVKTAKTAKNTTKSPAPAPKKAATSPVKKITSPAPAKKTVKKPVTKQMTEEEAFMNDPINREGTRVLEERAALRELEQKSIERNDMHRAAEARVKKSPKEVYRR